MSSGGTIPAVRPKRLLSIDGGGLAGLIPAEALIEMERQLDEITGNAAPLSDRFDLIGGTSTGAILAAGLCLGLRAAQLRDFYLKFGHEIFTKVFLPERFWHSYSAGPLEKHLKEVFGEDTALGDAKLRTHVLIVAKNATQGTTWFFTNNRRGKYFAANANLPLWQIVRASSAAPTYFPPQMISIPDARGQLQDYEFIDGGVSSYNNPSLQLFLEATDPRYQFGWPTGPDKLLLISLGTGFNSVTVAASKAAAYNLLDWARYLIREMMAEANLEQNLLMHVLGQAPSGGTSQPAAEMAAARSAGHPTADAFDFLGAVPGATKALTYQRVTISFTRVRLDGLNLRDIDPEKVGEMDAADQIGNLQRVGQAVAQEQIRMDRLKQFFV
jgi:predicted acylesterase/phospholipase RssA